MAYAAKLYAVPSLSPRFVPVWRRRNLVRIAITTSTTADPTIAHTSLASHDWTAVVTVNTTSHAASAT